MRDFIAGAMLAIVGTALFVWPAIIPDPWRLWIVLVMVGFIVGCLFVVWLNRYAGPRF